MADDYVRLALHTGPVTLKTTALNLDWPPPEYLWLAEGGKLVPFDSEPTDLDELEMRSVLRRVSMSQLTDAEIEQMTHVVRGAEYHYLTELEDR